MKDGVINRESFAAAVRAARGRLTLDEVAACSGVPRSTHLRAEQGQRCGSDIFLRLCTWMRKSPAEFISVPRVAREETTLGKIEQALYRDPSLDADGVDALARLMRAAYERGVERS
jgi:hypothetical protein